MIHKIVFTAILILLADQIFSQDSIIKGRIINYEPQQYYVIPNDDSIRAVMPGVIIFDLNDRRNGVISDRDGNFKIEVKGNKRNLELSFVGCYPIRFINIPEGYIDLREIKLLRNHLDDNIVLGGPSNPFSNEQTEKDKKLRTDVLEKYRIEILGKKLKPYFEGRYLVFDFNQNGDK